MPITINPSAAIDTKTDNNLNIILSPALRYSQEILPKIKLSNKIIKIGVITNKKISNFTLFFTISPFLQAF
jgi:hypothetical protein